MNIITTEDFHINEILTTKILTLGQCFEKEQQILNQFNYFRVFKGRFNGFTECFDIAAKDQLLKEFT